MNLLKKRAMSQVITTLLIIFIIFIAISIVWVVLRNLISQQSELSEAKAKFLQANIGIQSVRFDDGGTLINISLKNLAGKIKTYREGENISPQGVDVYSVVDLSLSMRCSEGIIGEVICFQNKSTCESEPCNGVWLGPISSSKSANLNLVDTILENNLGKVGLVAYNHGVIPLHSHDLDNNTASLISTINGWSASGRTCICCGIINATERFQAQSPNDIKKAMIVMSDGVSEDNCSLGGNASEDAITSACQAYSNLNDLTIYAVGLGDNVDEQTLQGIALCGNGQYFNTSSIDDLVEIYEFIAQEIQVEQESINPFGHLLFVFYNNESESAQIRVYNIPDVLEIENYEFDLTGILNPLIIKIEVYPVIISSSGEEIIGPLLDSWERQ